MRRDMLAPSFGSDDEIYIPPTPVLRLPCLPHTSAGPQCTPWPLAAVSNYKSLWSTPYLSIITLPFLTVVLHTPGPIYREPPLHCWSSLLALLQEATGDMCTLLFRCTGVHVCRWNLYCTEHVYRCTDQGKVTTIECQKYWIWIREVWLMLWSSNIWPQR